MDRHEIKYINTEKKIQRTFLKLLESHKFEDISVTMLCWKAGINRSTFYNHYGNTYAMVVDIQEKLIGFFKEQMREKGIWAERSEDESGNDFIFEEKFYVEFLKFVKQYRSLFVIMESNVRYFDFGASKNYLKNKLVARRLQRNGVYDEQIREYIFELILKGSEAVVDKWVRGGCAEPVEQIAFILSESFKKVLSPI